MPWLAVLLHVIIIIIVIIARELSICQVPVGVERVLINLVTLLNLVGDPLRLPLWSHARGWCLSCQTVWIVVGSGFPS